MNGTATNPASDHLFKVRGNAHKLNKERAEFSFVSWHSCCLLHSAIDQTFEQRFIFWPRESRRPIKMITKS